MSDDRDKTRIRSALDAGRIYSTGSQSALQFSYDEEKLKQMQQQITNQNQQGLNQNANIEGLTQNGNPSINQVQGGLLNG